MMELLDLDSLTEEERTIILNVIRRDDELRRRQENRISQVKQELHNLRMNSVLRQGDDLSKICARCKAPFGFITNTGEVCPVCRFRVCRNCRENLLTHGWMCILCFKENQLRWLSGDWMVKDKGKNHKPFSNGTDLVRASLRIKRSSGRFSSDFDDSDDKESGADDGPDEKTAINRGSLGGLEERAGHNSNANRAAGAPGPASQHSPDSNNKRLSTLFDSIRLGLGGGGGGSGGGSDDAAAELPTVGAVGGVGGPGCGGVVVQHVSCRRRRDSNSSSSSDSDSDWQGAKRRVYSEMNGAALQPSGPQGGGPGRYYGARSDTESAGRCSAGSGSAEREPRVGSLSQSLSSGASASTVRERGRERDAEGVRAGWGGEDAGRAPVGAAAAARPTGRTPQREASRKSEGRRRKEAVAAGPFQRQSTLDGDRPSSGCSFTSSEWGEVTPTESAPGLATQPAQDKDRKEEAGSALGHSSGYVSASRRSFDVGDSSLNNNNSSPPLLDHDAPAAAPKCRTLPSRPSRLSARSRQDSKDSSSLDAPHHPDTPPPPPPPPHRARNNSATRAAQGLVRRQSSGRSESLSTCSAKTASPATKMRLLDLASNRALERDGDDSLKSWSAGSEDTMSLGMSCSGLQAAPDAPVFQKVHYKRPKGCGQDQARPGDRAGPKDPSGVNEEEEEQDTGTDSAYSTTGSTATSVHIHHSDDAETNDGNSDQQSISSGTISPMLTKAGFGRHSESSPEAHLSEPGAQGGQAEPAAAAEQAQGEDCNDLAGEGQDLAAVTPHGHQTAAEETAEGFGRESKGRGSGGPSEEENCIPRDPTSKQTPGEDESLPNEVSAPHVDEVERRVDEPVGRELASLENQGDQGHSKPVKSPEGCSTPSLEEQVAEVEKLRSPEQELPYTLQRYFLVDDSASDTLSIISERTEPGDNNEDDMDEGEERDAQPSDDSDSEGTVHDDLDGHWSDDSNDVLECAGTTTPTKVSASVETAELLASLQQQLESEEKPPEPKQTEGSPACEEHLPAVSRDPGDEGDISKNPQVAQQTGKLPEGALLEVSSTQAEVFPVCRDELEEVQDLIAQADQKAVILSRHILQEDSSTTAEQVLPVTIGKDNGDQVQGWLTEQEERRPQPLKPFSEDETQEAASLPRNQHHHSDDQSVVLPALPGRQSGTVSTGAVTSPVPHELAEESDELDLAKKRTKPGQADSCDSGESGREDGSPDLSERKVSLPGEPADAEAGKLSVAGKAEAVLASSPVDVSIRKEAVFLDEQAAGGQGCRRVSAHGAGGGGGDAECFICKAVCSEGKMHAVNADWPYAELQGGGMSDSEKTGRGDVGTENVSNSAGSCLTNTPGFVEVLLVNTNTENVPKPAGEGREDAAPEKRGWLQKTGSAASGHHLTSTQTCHDSDRDSARGSAAFLTEDKLGLQRELSAEGSRRPSLPNDYLPEAEVDLDDPCLYPATTVAAVWDSVGGGASPGLPNDRGLRARDGEVVSQFSVPARGSAGEVASSPSSGTTTTRLSIVALGARETEVQHVPRLNQPRQSDADRTGSSDQSDTDPTSPAKRSNSPRSGTPQRSSHLSIPSTVASSHTGSIDEKSLAEDDNIDELFAKHQMGGRLGFSRSSIGDSRESLASVYSDAGEINYGRIPVSGEITFGLEYDHKLSVLKIHIKGCRDLAPVDTKHNRSDPYVKVYLLPDKTRSGKRKSKIKKHTLNPVYNETLTYNISQGELENRTLWVTVWHSDRFGRNDFLGEVTIPMDLHRFGDTTPKTYTLQSRMPDTMNESAMQYKGDLIISLMYITPDQAAGGKKSKSKSKKSKAAAEALGEIHCLVKAANNLTAVRSNGTSDPFVKGYLLPDRGRTGKQKTPVVKNSVNPTWNHNLVFDSVDAMELADRSLELTVWDHEKLGTNEFLGGARLNLGLGVVKEGLHVDWMDARGEESMAWQSMMEQPNTWIDARLPLRASMGKANAKK